VTRRGLPILAVWAALGLALSAVTAHVADWFVMTDELLYERLAIAIARTGSPVPRVHGVSVHSFSQLYPLLIAPAFAHGGVPHDLHLAHLANAWIMSSACIPAFLLARRVTRRPWAGYLVGTLAVLMPWIVYAPFLLTEVAAYPAFLWCLLALHRATAAPSPRTDVVALLGLALAYFARTEFAVLLVVPPLAIAASAWGRRPLRETARAHRVLLAGYGLLALAAVVLAAAGRLADALGTYRTTVGSRSLPHGFLRSLLEHLSTLSLGVGILPLVVGLAWLLANLVRRPEDDDELRAFAALASVAGAALLVEVTVYDLRFGGGFVHDRYLVYLLPLVLVAFVCALLDPRRPRVSLALSAALVAAGFALGGAPDVALPDRFGRLNPDTPIAAFWKLARDAFGGAGAARVALALAAVAAAGVFALAARFLRPRQLVAAGTVLLVVALPLETGYVLRELLDHDGWASRPLTGPPAGTLTWIDGTLGRNASVAIVPHPTSEDYFASQQVWRDLEFWNLAVDRDVQYPDRGVFQPTGDAFPKVYPRFDPRTGASDVSPAPFVAQAEKETRFRISGPVRATVGGVLLIRAGPRWRTDWLTSGLYDDGWTMPGRSARVRVFAKPGQRGARTRYLTFQVWAPDGVANRPFAVASNLQRDAGAVSEGTTAVRTVRVCVPAEGFAEVSLRTPQSSAIPGDLTSTSTIDVPRRGGVFLAQIALADEVGPRCRPT
jgi:hypothetical protein